jgi:hypothetical protein
MIFFKLILLSFFTQAWAQEKILFVDLNKGKTEIAAARRVAKAKGKELIVYPSEGEEFKLENLKTIITGNSFSSLCLSGHNGGNSYGGETGSVDVGELMSAIASSPSHQTIEGLYLLGCNGANKNKIFFWKEALPNLKFIAGYDGSAPLSSNANGVKYFEDALGKQSQITASKNAQILKQLMTTLNSVNNFESAVYASCGPLKKEYLYLPRRSGSERFGEFSSQECVAKIHVFKSNYLETIKKYWSGELEPTLQNPSSGFLKDAYVFMRQNEHCFADEDLMGFDGDQLLFLRFNNAFNENYFEYYKDQLTSYLNELNQFTDNTEAFLAKIKAEEIIILKKLEDIIANPGIYQPIIDQEKKKINQNRKAMLDADPVFARCMSGVNAQQSCERFESKFLRYYQFEDQIFALDNYEEEIRNKMARIKLLDVDSLSYYSKKEETLKLKQLIEKSIAQPSKITRKEIMEMSHLRLGMPSFSEVVGVSSRSYFQNLENINGYNFPFSWHERIEGKPVEPPLNSRDHAVRYFSQSISKEHSVLALILDDRL